MKFLRRINPTRAIMGRLFFWFWATFIVTAVLAVWGSRLLFEDLQVNAALPEELADLEQVAERISSPRAARGPLMMALERNSRPFHGRAIAVDLDTKRFVSPGGPPLREKERTDILRIVDQQVPISLVRGAFRVVGPMQFERGDKRYALFLLRFEGPSGNSMPFFLILFIAIK